MIPGLAIDTDMLCINLEHHLPAEDLLDTIREIIVDYPTCAVESGEADMKTVMNRVSVLGTLAHLIEESSFICK